MATLVEMQVMSGMRFDVSGQQVTYCMVDYAFSLHLEGGLNLRVESDFIFTDASGTVHGITPESDPTTCGPALGLARATTGSLVTTDDGVLEIEFEDGARIVVPPSEDYEAWSLTERNGVKVVSTPGGELATWGPLESDDGS